MNRSIVLPEMKTGDMISYELDQAFFAHWNRKLAGTQVPVFSLRSEKVPVWAISAISRR